MVAPDGVCDVGVLVQPLEEVGVGPAGVQGHVLARVGAHGQGDGGGGAVVGAEVVLLGRVVALTVLLQGGRKGVRKVFVR